MIDYALRKENALELKFEPLKHKSGFEEGLKLHHSGKSEEISRVENKQSRFYDSI